LRFQHGGGDRVLAGNQLYPVLLSDQFIADRPRKLGIGFGEGGGKEPLQTGGGSLLVHDKPTGW